jgi:murein DD-endopeptidase MepM/ murein hydrolase activator NlpD
MGNWIRIDHGDGVETYYSSLSEVAVEEGQTVKAGDTLGKAGTSAGSEVEQGPHLHFELLVDGKNVNPQPYLPG